MGKREILVTPYGELLDMLACFAIENGATQKGRGLTTEDKFFNIT